MSLQLTRPIAFIDLETTGVNLSSDRIIEVAIIKILPDGSRAVKRKLINPGMPIPPASTEIHGITNEMVKDAPTFKQAGNELKQFIENCDMGGYNSNRFDIPMLMEEFLRAGMDVDLCTRRMVDVQHIFYTMEPRTLTAAYKFYCQKEIENAHSAEADIVATFEVLEAQLERYPDLQNDVDYLHEFSCNNSNVDLAGRVVFNENKQEVFNFGKHKGKSVREVFKKDASYYDWIMQGDFATNTKNVITQLRLKDFNKI